MVTGIFGACFSPMYVSHFITRSWSYKLQLLQQAVLVPLLPRTAASGLQMGVRMLRGIAVHMTYEVVTPAFPPFTAFFLLGFLPPFRGKVGLLPRCKREGRQG